MTASLRPAVVVAQAAAAQAAVAAMAALAALSLSLSLLPLLTVLRVGVGEEAALVPEADFLARPKAVDVGSVASAAEDALVHETLGRR